MKSSKLWKKTLITLFAIQILFAIAISSMAAMDFSLFAENFGFTAQPTMGILQHIVVYNMFLSGGICVLGILWVRKDNIAGYQAAMLLGTLMFLVSFIVAIKFDRVDMIVYDSIRAIVMTVLGYMGYQVLRSKN
jgi:hypothetical protein